jgi:hypothetical protein
MMKVVVNESLVGEVGEEPFLLPLFLGFPVE